MSLCSCEFESHHKYQMYKNEVRPCIDCQKVKPFDEFYKRIENGRPKSICKKCDRRRLEKYRSTEASKSAARASGQIWANNNRDKRDKSNRGSWLKTRFGITLDEYNEILKGQNGVCAICKQPESVKGRKNLAVDHCHETGKIRGLLCTFCNTALGKLKEDISIMENMIEYIGNHS